MRRSYQLATLDRLGGPTGVSLPTQPAPIREPSRLATWWEPRSPAPTRPAAPARACPMSPQLLTHDPEDVDLRLDEPHNRV